MITLDWITAHMEMRLRRASTLAEAVQAVDAARDEAADIGEPEPETPADDCWAHLKVGSTPWQQNDESMPIWAWDATRVLAGEWPEVHVMTRREYAAQDERGDVCPSCAGSGIGWGPIDSSRCSSCAGWGVRRPPRGEREYDREEEYERREALRARDES